VLAGEPAAVVPATWHGRWSYGAIVGVPRSGLYWSSARPKSC